jgi:hypothetical protein
VFALLLCASKAAEINVVAPFTGAGNRGRLIRDQEVVKMRTHRESSGGSLLRRYLEYVDIRSFHMRYYTGFASTIIPRRPRTVVDLTSPALRKESEVRRSIASPIH